MVTVTNYTRFQRKEDGKELFALILQGAAEFIRSATTNKLYMTAKSTSILTTFDENKCKSLQGIVFPGSIIKVKCEEYDYIIRETQEAIRLDFRYEYSEEPANIEEAVFEVASN
jgi:hypothetical protein